MQYSRMGSIFSQFIVMMITVEETGFNQIYIENSFTY